METNNQKNDQNIIPNDADKQQKGVNVPNLRFKEFSTSYNNYKLKECCKLITKGTTPHEFTSSGINFVKIDSINGVLLDNKKFSFISEKTHIGELKRSILKENDILLAIAGATVGKHCIVKKNDLPANTNQALSIIRTNDKLLPKYLLSIFDTSFIPDYIRMVCASSAQPNLNLEQVGNMNLFIPTIQEQIRIVKFMDLINNQIDTQSKIIEDLELFEKEINNTIINKLVEHKDLVKFSSIYNFAKEGGTPNTSHPEYYTKGSIPFVKIDDLTTKYLVSNQSFITKLGLENSSAWLIPANSILYSNGATIGAISINKYPVTTKQGILGIVPKSDYLSEYLYYFLRSNYFKKEICKITTQGTMKSAYIKDIDNILVPRINKNQQNEILTLLSEITLKIQKEKDMLELYKKQKAYLLKNMFI